MTRLFATKVSYFGVRNWKPKKRCKVSIVKDCHGAPL